MLPDLSARSDRPPRATATAAAAEQQQQQQHAQQQQQQAKQQQQQATDTGRKSEIEAQVRAEEKARLTLRL